MESAAIFIFSLHAFADAAASRDVTYIETQKAVRAGNAIERISPGRSIRTSVKAILEAVSDTTRQRAARSLKLKLLRLELRLSGPLKIEPV